MSCRLRLRLGAGGWGCLLAECVRGGRRQPELRRQCCRGWSTTRFWQCKGGSAGPRDDRLSVGGHRVAFARAAPSPQVRMARDQHPPSRGLARSRLLQNIVLWRLNSQLIGANTARPRCWWTKRGQSGKAATLHTVSHKRLPTAGPAFSFPSNFSVTRETNVTFKTSAREACMRPKAGTYSSYTLAVNPVKGRVKQRRFYSASTFVMVTQHGAFLRSKTCVCTVYSYQGLRKCNRSNTQPLCEQLPADQSLPGHRSHAYEVADGSASRACKQQQQGGTCSEALQARRAVQCSCAVQADTPSGARCLCAAPGNCVKAQECLWGVLQALSAHSSSSSFWPSAHIMRGQSRHGAGRALFLFT